MDINRIENLHLNYEVPQMEVVSMMQHGVILNDSPDVPDIGDGGDIIGGGGNG